MINRLFVPFAALAALAACAGSPEPDMTVEEYLTLNDQVSRNSAAHLQPDTRRMLKAGEDAVAAVREAQDAARRQGRRPPNCLPDTQSVTTVDILEALDSLEMPAELRATETLEDALLTWAERTYPCFG
jgi:hypothetical protein